MYVPLLPLFWIGEMIECHEDVSTALKRPPFFARMVTHHDGEHVLVFPMCFQASWEAPRWYCMIRRIQAWLLLSVLGCETRSCHGSMQEVKKLRWIKKSLEGQHSYTQMQLLNSTTVEVENYQLKWEYHLTTSNFRLNFELTWSISWDSL